jgi:DUF1680 family protein|tara:strand:+ start:437 stop:586 length:150 start_codon:yes stop_codon:yes gene_type:complete
MSYAYENSDLVEEAEALAENIRRLHRYDETLQEAIDRVVEMLQDLEHEE